MRGEGTINPFFGMESVFLHKVQILYITIFTLHVGYEYLSHYYYLSIENH